MVRSQPQQREQLAQQIFQERSFAEQQKLQAEYDRSEEHTSELQSLMRISYAVFCLKKKTKHSPHTHIRQPTRQTHIQIFIKNTTPTTTRTDNHIKTVPQ